MKYLLTRFGGIGDSAPIMVVARELKKRGHEVDIALREDDHGNAQIDLLMNTDCFDRLMTLKEVGPWRTRCIQFEHGWVDIKSVYGDYDEVIDYMHIIEYNDTCKSSFISGPMSEWKKHRNSNWRNWYDLHLEWANIDPTSLTEEEKCPEYVLSEEEKKEVDAIRSNYEAVFVINPNASSLARTWYQAEELIPKLLEDYDNPLILYWKPDKALWQAYNKSGSYSYKSPVESSLRASMCVVAAADVYVGADTGFTHIAEGLGVDHLAIYSSVPWWTRAKYYRFQRHIDNGYHTFSLTLGDPNRIQEGMDDLGKKERLVLDLHKSGTPIEEAARQLNTTTEGVDMEMQAVYKKLESFERVQSKSLSEVDVQEVVDEIEQILKYEVE